MKDEENSHVHMLRLATLGLLAIAATSSAFAKEGRDNEIFADRGKIRKVDTQGCPDGTFSIVTAPDGSSVSILFDNFKVEGTDANAGFARMTCSLEIPLHLPAGTSLGVTSFDYRGFAHLEEKQRGELSVAYGTGSGERNRGRRHGDKLKGVYDGDFLFTERLKGGLLKRMGCGDEAVLNFAATLMIESKKGPKHGQMTLDSVDGVQKSGLVFGLNVKQCKPGGGHPDEDEGGNNNGRGNNNKARN